MRVQFSSIRRVSMVYFATMYYLCTNLHREGCHNHCRWYYYTNSILLHMSFFEGAFWIEDASKSHHFNTHVPQAGLWQAVFSCMVSPGRLEVPQQQECHTYCFFVTLSGSSQICLLKMAKSSWATKSKNVPFVDRQTNKHQITERIGKQKPCR